MVPEIRWRALHSNILVLAKQGGLGTDWAAYIFPVPGINHDEEHTLWKKEGEKLPYNIARIIFPNFDSKYRWRP